MRRGIIAFSRVVPRPQRSFLEFARLRIGRNSSWAMAWISEPSRGRRAPRSFNSPRDLSLAMPGLELVPLDSSEAEAYFKVFVAGRSDLPNPDPIVHLDRYLAMPPEEQRTYFAFKESGGIVGTVRLVGSEISFFSLLPDERRWARDAILLAVEPIIAAGAEKIVANFEEAYSPGYEKLGLEQQFGMHVGGPQEWREYVTGIWKGETGTYLPLASWTARDERGLTGISLVTLWMGMPLLAEIGVRKDLRGRGLGRALLTSSLNSLADLNHDRPALFVTVGNESAIALYKSFGFESVARTG